MMSHLKFSTSPYCDTSLAKEYLKQKGSSIHSLGLECFENEDYEHDCCHNKICYVDKAKVKILRKEYGYHKLIDMYKELARKIEENTNLFIQLEYMIRKVPKNDTFSSIKLIIHNFYYWSTQCQPTDYESFEYNAIIMDENSPLATLGCLAPYLWVGSHGSIVSSKESAAVCHLFTQLCHEVGLESVCLMLVKDPEEFKNDQLPSIKLTEVQDLAGGGAGVVSGHADVDSAVDTFLSASSTSLWGLKRILVQENAYDSFKNAISWKSSLKASNQGDVQQILDVLASKCNGAYTYDSKVVLLDYVGDIELLQKTSKVVIQVEAYRTTKELLSLLKQYKPFSLSLWCNDVAEANEIAFGVDTSIVWINDIDNFSGPPKLSQALYSKVLTNYSFITIGKTEENDTLIQLYNSWLKLDVNERRKKICAAIKKCDLKGYEELKDVIEDLQRTIYHDTDKFIEVEEGNMFVGLQEPVGIVSMNFGKVIVEIIKSTVFGNGVLYGAIDIDDFANCLKSEGVPIVKGSFKKGDSIRIYYPYALYKMRVIFTNFGTIFAN